GPPSSDLGTRDGVRHRRGRPDWHRPRDQRSRSAVRRPVRGRRALRRAGVRCRSVRGLRAPDRRVPAGSPPRAVVRSRLQGRNEVDPPFAIIAWTTSLGTLACVRLTRPADVVSKAAFVDMIFVTMTWFWTLETTILIT